MLPVLDALTIVARALRIELLAQLALAVLLGGAIGLERELRGKPAGLRTNVLICIGAALFTVLSYRIGQGGGDPSRIAAQVLTGVGFIGAGTILHTRGAVGGLTSAATIWVVAAIGMALGSRAYIEAVGSTVLVLAVLMGLERLESRLTARDARAQLLIHVRPDAGALPELESLVTGEGLLLESSRTRQDGAELVVELEVLGSRAQIDRALLLVVQNPRVLSVSTGE